MPVRTKKGTNTQKEVVNDIISDLNLNFLPREYVQRIDDIFEGFFNLGLPYSQVDKDVLDAPTFPRNISSLSSSELGDILGEYTAWYSYISDKFKYIATASTYINGELQKAMDRVLGEMVTGGGNIDAKKAKARSSEEYQTINSYAVKLNGIRGMLEEDLANYDKCISSLSREVTRREHNGGF